MIVRSCAQISRAGQAGELSAVRHRSQQLLFPMLVNFRNGTHDQDVVAIVEAIHLLMPPPDEPKEPFGFRRAKKN